MKTHADPRSTTTDVLPEDEVIDLRERLVGVAPRHAARPAPGAEPMGSSVTHLSEGLPGLYTRPLVEKPNPAAHAALVIGVVAFGVLLLRLFWIAIPVGLVAATIGYLGLRAADHDAEVVGRTLAAAAVALGFGAALLGGVGALSETGGTSAANPTTATGGAAGLHYRIKDGSCAVRGGLAAYEGTISNLTTSTLNVAVVVSFSGADGIAAKGGDSVSIPPQGSRTFHASAATPGLQAVQCSVTEVREKT